MPKVWQPSFYLESPFFQAFQSLWSGLCSPNWPDHNRLNQLFHAHVAGPCWEKIRFVPDEQGHYEWRIHQRREVPTRLQNWHDLFNAITWIQWSQSKMALNQRSIGAYLKSPAHRFKKRTMLQNRLALFDESGMVIIGPKKILNLIREKKWVELFVENGSLFNHSVYFKIFGHALYEKCLKPYIGLTAHALLIDDVQLENWDASVAAYLKSPHCFKKKSDLVPFPMLGIPGYYAANAHPDFYENKNYFRS